MEKIKFIKKLILEFENDSQVNKFIVYLAKTFLKYVVTIVICIFIWFIWIFIAIFIWDNFKQENLCALVELTILCFMPSIIYIYVFSKDKITIHPIIVTLLLPIGFFGIFIFGYFYQNYSSNTEFSKKHFIEAIYFISVIIISLILTSGIVNSTHFLLLMLFPKLKK